VLCMLLGQQVVYTKYPCFMCEWNSTARGKHWEQKRWTPKTSLEPGSKNILCKSYLNSIRKLHICHLKVWIDFTERFGNEMLRIIAS
jgi:hypothetical protein